MNFDDLKLAPAILKAVREQGYDTPTPIQAQAIPAVLEGHDLLAGAQTGTGKTAAFTLPLLHKLTMSRRFLAEAFGIHIETDLKRIAYCGDSPNDSPMYAVFPLGVGVANIRPYAKLMAHLPNYVTEGEGGHGFAEAVRWILKQRGE